MGRGADKMHTICLCSQSDTRAKLLTEFDIPFVQRKVDFDEDSIEATNAREFVYAASKGKIEAAQKLYGLDMPLLCADTVIVAGDGTILRKAKDIDDARKILQKQSGSNISIITSIHYRSSSITFVDISATSYSFAPFDTDDMESYLKSGRWIGKAGACMVEGFCKKYILSVDGLESTAMGLQVEVLMPWIEFDKIISTKGSIGAV